MRLPNYITCPAFLLLIGATTGATAAEVETSYFSHAAANCQSALPVFDGNIRKRPKALANEGTSIAFVTCAFEQTPTPPNKIVRVIQLALNRGGVARTVSCTLVDGIRDEVLSPSHTQTVTLNGNGVWAALVWDADLMNEGTNYTSPALSCSLPPGVELSGTAIDVLREIGD
jgi:hypothetical protein